MKLMRVKLRPRLKLKRKTAVKLGAIVLVFGLVVGMAAVAIHLATGPADGTVLKSLPVKSAALTGNQVLAGKYFTTHYPARYSEVPSGTTASLQSWTLVGHLEDASQESSKLTLVISPIPTGGVKEGSAYKLFAAYPTFYKLSDATYGHEPVIVAVRQDSGYQQTVLWPHGKYLLSISMTTGTESPVVDSEMQTVLTHLQWLL